jgi:hypothetical protein
MNTFNSPRYIDDRSQATETDPTETNRHNVTEERPEEHSSRHHHHHQYEDARTHAHHPHSAFASPFLDGSRPSSTYYPGWPHYASHAHQRGSSSSNRHPAYYEHKSSRMGDHNQYPEDPPSPPRFHRGPSLPPHFAYSRQHQWPEDQSRGTPTRSNRQPRDYSYHPGENSQRSPNSRNGPFSVDGDPSSDTEFVGLRFVPTDAPPPPPPPSHASPPPLPPPPPPQLQSPAQPAPLPSIRTSPNVARRVPLHPGSRGEYIWDTRAYDVLCGRGVPTSHQWGNHLFKCLVKERQIEYIACERNEKSRLATEIMDVIGSYHGRFLRRVKVPDRQERFAWVELTEQRSYEKVCQALRDGGPRIREAMMAVSAKAKKNSSADKENAVNCPRYGNR